MIITDRVQATRPLPDIIHECLDAGCRWVLLRDPEAAPDSLRKDVGAIQSLCKTYGAMFSISRHMDMAKELGADGIHLSANQSLKEARAACASMIIGKSCHSLDEAVAAQRDGAAYITLSPIFISPSKPDYGPALGLDRLQTIALELSIPVMALGGVATSNAALCLCAGARGVAVMGEIMRAPRPGIILSQLLQSCDYSCKDLQKGHE